MGPISALVREDKFQGDEGSVREDYFQMFHVNTMRRNPDRKRHTGDVSLLTVFGISLNVE